MPSRVAVAVVEPAATAFASPDGLMVATFESASVQVADAVTFAVEPSLYVAMALNCSVAPMAMRAVPGDAAMAVNTLVEPPGARDEDPPHPTAAASSEREKPRSRLRKEL
jgi:hypothetical protein